MTVKELVERFGITKIGNGMISVPKSAESISASDEIKSKKAEIIAYLSAKEEEKKRAREERKAKIDAIEGLKEIRAALEDLSAWDREFEKSFENCGGFGVRKKPEYDLDGLFKNYPIAYAYLKAEENAYSNNYEIAAIGHKALETIINDPQNYENAIAEMKREISEFVKRHVFD